MFLFVLRMGMVLILLAIQVLKRSYILWIQDIYDFFSQLRICIILKTSRQKEDFLYTGRYISRANRNFSTEISLWPVSKRDNIDGENCPPVACLSEIFLDSRNCLKTFPICSIGFPLIEYFLYIIIFFQEIHQKLAKLSELWENRGYLSRGGTVMREDIKINDRALALQDQIIEN